MPSVQLLQPPRAPSPTKPMAERPAIEGLEAEHPQPPLSTGSPWQTRSPRSPPPQPRLRSVSPTRSPHPLSPPRGRLEPMAFRPERSFVQVDFVGRRTPQGLHRGLTRGGVRGGDSGSPTPQRQRGGVRGASKTLRPDLASVVPAATPLRRPSTGYYKS